MAPPSTTESPVAWPSQHRTRERIVTTLAILIPILAYVEVEATPGWYPTWLYLGELTLPTGLLPPFVFAVVVLYRTLDSYRNNGQFGNTETLEGILAATIALLSVYAVWTLNVASPGVFWAGLPPMVVGVLLAAAVLARHVGGRLAG